MLTVCNVRAPGSEISQENNFHVEKNEEEGDWKMLTVCVM